MTSFRCGRAWLSEAFLDDVLIVVKDGTIRTLEIGVGLTATTVNLSAYAVVPAPVNGHLHSFQSLLRGVADDLPFAGWRDALYHCTPLLTPDDVELLALCAYSEAALRGSGTVIDFFYLHHGGNEHALRLARAAETVGIRLVIARGMVDSEEAPAAYRETPHQAAANFRELRRELQDHPLVSVIPAPHSPHRASAAMIEVGAELAAEYGCPWHIHLAEAQSESKFTLERYGATPLRWLASLGVLGPLSCLVHGVWLNAEEIALVAQAEARLIHCPSSNMFLGDGIAPIAEYLKRGVAIALGSDSGSANNRLSLFGEMRQAALLARVAATDKSALSSRAVFAMGTANGRLISGQAVGAIKESYAADFVALDPRAPSLLPGHDLLANTVFSLEQEAIKEVYVGGRPIVHDGALNWRGAAELPVRLNALSSRLGLRRGLDLPPRGRCLDQDTGNNRSGT